MSKTTNPTKVITGNHTVMSYLNVNEPKVPLGGGTPEVLRQSDHPEERHRDGREDSRRHPGRL